MFFKAKSLFLSMKIAVKILTLALFIALCALGVLYKEKDRQIRQLEFERDSIRIHNERMHV